MGNKSTELAKIRTQKYHKIINNYKLERGCDKCGYNKHACALDFHHKNPEMKTKSVSDLVRKPNSLERIFEEIDKCMLLCANCHRVVHCS